MIKVLSSGILTTIQDLGRLGFANIGVPVSGVMDQYSAKLSNAILGNSESDAVLEITFGGCKFSFLESSFICISGADYSAKLNEQEIPLNKAIKVNTGDVLAFDKKRSGIRTYVAVLGGFQAKKILNSRSYFKNITKQEKVKKGDCLPFNVSVVKSRATYASIKVDESHFETKIITCFRGPEYGLLSKNQKEQLENKPFTISNDNSRMGYRLKEKVPGKLKSMLTSAVLPGTVQLTPSGKIIILMRDCQVTGGYPRILVLTDDAINILAQKSTNDSIYFKIIGLPK